jgi:hypothetical protein
VQVTDARKWTIVGKALGYNVTANTGICSQLKMAYFRIIVPFEEYVKHVKLAGGPAPPDPVKEATVRDTAQSEEMKAFADKLADAPKMGNGSATLATPTSENGSRTAVPASERVRTASDKLNEALDLQSSKRGKVSAPGEVNAPLISFTMRNEPADQRHLNAGLRNLLARPRP